MIDDWLDLGAEAAPCIPEVMTRLHAHPQAGRRAQSLGRRKSMALLTPAAPLSMRGSAARVTPSRSAASVTAMSASHSRRAWPGCGGLCMVAMTASPVVVLVVDEYRAAAFEDEGQPPTAVDPDRPVPAQIALERMQLPARRVHVAWLARFVQHARMNRRSCRVPGLNARGAAGQEETFNAFVPE